MLHKNVWLYLLYIVKALNKFCLIAIQKEYQLFMPVEYSWEIKYFLFFLFLYLKQDIFKYKNKNNIYIILQNRVISVE